MSSSICMPPSAVSQSWSADQLDVHLVPSVSVRSARRRGHACERRGRGLTGSVTSSALTTTTCRTVVWFTATDGCRLEADESWELDGERSSSSLMRWITRDNWYLMGDQSGVTKGENNTKRGFRVQIIILVCSPQIINDFIFAKICPFIFAPRHQIHNKRWTKKMDWDWPIWSPLTGNWAVWKLKFSTKTFKTLNLND